MSSEQLHIDPHVALLRESVGKSLQDFGLVASARYRFYLTKFITSKQATFPEDHINHYCSLFNTALEKELARSVTRYINDYVEAVQAALDTAPGPDSASETSGKAVRQISLYLATLLKRLFEGCSERCLTSSNTCVYTFRELNSLTGEFHTDVTARLQRHTIKLIELFSVYHRVKLATAEQTVALVKKSTDAISASDADEKTEEDKPCGIPMEAYTLVDAFGRGLLAPLEIYFSIENKDPAEVRGTAVFPRVFCGPLLDVIKIFLVGQDKYNATNSALLSELVKFCRNEDFDDGQVRSFYMHKKLRSYLTSYFLFMLKTMLKGTKRENFLVQVNTNIHEKDPSCEIQFDKQHFSMLTNSWGRFALDNIDSVSAEKAALKILKRYIPSVIAEANRRAEVLARKQAKTQVC